MDETREMELAQTALDAISREFVVAVSVRRDPTGPGHPARGWRVRAVDDHRGEVWDIRADHLYDAVCTLAETLDAHRTRVA